MGVCINDKCPLQACPCIGEPCGNCTCPRRINCTDDCAHCKVDCDARRVNYDSSFEDGLVIMLIAKRIAETDGACDVCVWKDKCCAELDAAPDGEWNPPANDVCAENIVKYFKKLVNVD